MKKVKFLAMLLFAGMAFTACSDDDDEIDPQSEAAETTDVVTFEGSYWDALIDSPQYGGQLLYGATADEDYSWTDQTTTLTGGMTNSYDGHYGYSEGGTAISNYIDSNTAEHNTYTYQLAVPESNGSKNFAVVYCGATIKFSDGKARIIDSMDMSLTTYLQGVIENGDGYARALTESSDYLRLLIKTDTGKTLTVGLAAGGGHMVGWQTISLKNLGAVTSLTFSMESSDNSAWGPKDPTYFAFDNVVVEK